MGAVTKRRAGWDNANERTKQLPYSRYMSANIATWRHALAIVLGVLAMVTVQGFWPMEWPAWLGFWTGMAGMFIAFDVVGMPGPRPRPRRRVLGLAAGLAASAVITYLMHRFLGLP